MSEEKTGLEMKYFVLKPGGGGPYAEASISAMFAYVRSIREFNPKLADDLLEWASTEGARVIKET